jgi:hypothetical protein
VNAAAVVVRAVAAAATRPLRQRILRPAQAEHELVYPGDDAATSLHVAAYAPEGVLRGVEGVEEARSVEAVRWVRLYRRLGWRFGPLRRGADRAGAILAVAGSRDEALERGRRAAESVRFLVDADPP